MLNFHEVQADRIRHNDFRVVQRSLLRKIRWIMFSHKLQASTSGKSFMHCEINQYPAATDKNVLINQTQ